MILFLAGMILLFLDKERIINRLSDATAMNRQMAGRGSEAYYETYDLEKAGSGFEGTLLEFGAENCLSCRRMEAVIGEMRKEYSQKVAIQFMNLTEKAGLEEGRKFGVLMIPMQVLIDRQGMVVYKHTGYISSAELSDIIKEKILRD